MCVLVAPPLSRVVEPAAVVASEEVAPAECVRSHLRIDRRRLQVLVGERATLSGVLEEGAERAPAGQTVELERRAGRAWRTIARARTGSDGTYRITYSPWRTGIESVRVAFPGAASTNGTAQVAGKLEAFRLAGASWYGGGGTLACGGELTSSTIGVANKTLPCGTMVTLRYGGRTVRVPVIDRGPYVEGREFDLTEATKRELGFGSTGEVWTTS